MFGEMTNKGIRTKLVFEDRQMTIEQPEYESRAEMSDYFRNLLPIDPEDVVWWEHIIELPNGIEIWENSNEDAVATSDYDDDDQYIVGWYDADDLVGWVLYGTEELDNVKADWLYQLNYL